MKARQLIADQNSVEFDQLRRSFNNLLRMIESAQTSITAGATAANVLQAWADAVNTGVDSNPNAYTNYTSTNVPIEGAKPTPLVPKQVRGPLVDSAVTDTY